MFQGRYENRVSVHESSNDINICGTIADSIARIDPPFMFEKEDIWPDPGPVRVQCYGRLLKWLDHILDTSQTVSTDRSNELPEAYWRTLVGDHHATATRFPTDSAQLETTQAVHRYLNVTAM